MKAKRNAPFVLFLLLLAFLAICVLFRTLNKPSPSKQSPPNPKPPLVQSSPAPAEQPAPSEPTLADTVLEAYGSPQATYQEDTRLLHNFLTNVFFLVKQRDSRHYSTNEDLVLFLQGKNSNNQAYLPESHPYLDSNNRLLDRFGSPVHLHPVSRQLIQIRSAGPDTIPYTEDDTIYPPDRP